MTRQFMPLKRLSVAVALACCSLTVSANPQGAAIVSGNVNVNSIGNTLAVTQGSQRAIVNWQSFSIDHGETTNFNLPSASAAILNRVVTANPSRLLGTLNSNGQVYLINPNGVLVGNGAVINTGAFVASTRDVNDQQFMNGGNLDFFGNSNAAITNLGTISAGQGDVVLLAYQVDNAGTITAPAGSVSFASGTELLYAPAANDRVVIKATAIKDGGNVSNEGLISAAQAELKAAGGNPYALAVNVGGSISAISLDNVGGRIVLNARSGITQVSGDLTANNGEQGGEIIATGQHVALTETASLNASGKNGGGRIAVGGGYQGKDASLQNAETTTVAQGAALNADALDKGNGGQITLWADGDTSYRGHASVRGGINGGDGGFVEVSGKQRLDYRGTVDMRAPQGKNGTLLLDPTDITIVHAGAGSGLTVSGNTSTITDTDLGSALGSGNVILSTTSGGAGNGDITVAADTNPTAYVFTGINNTLTLQAERDITVNHSLVVFNNSPGNSGITLQAGRNLVINNPTGGNGDVGILANNLTLIADAANSGNGTSTMTIANGVVLSGDNIRLFVPTQAQLTLSSSTTIGGSTTVGKWVSDAGTSAQGIYYKSANGSSGNNTQTPGTNTQTPGTNLTPGQVQKSSTNGTIGVITIENPGTTINLFEHFNFFSSIDPQAREMIDADLGVPPFDPESAGETVNNLRKSIAYWESVLQNGDITPEFRKTIEEFLPGERDRLKQAEQQIVSNKAEWEKRRDAIYAAYSEIPGPQSEIDRLQAEIDSLTQTILDREIKIKYDVARTDALSMGLGGWITQLSEDADLNEQKAKLAALSMQKATIDGTQQKAQVAFIMVAKVSEILSHPGPYTPQEQALLDEVASRAQAKLVQTAQVQADAFDKWKAESDAKRVSQHMGTNLYTLLDVGDMPPNFEFLAQKQTGVGIGSSAAAAVSSALTLGITGTIAGSSSTAAKAVEKVMPFTAQRAKTAAKIAAGLPEAQANVDNLQHLLNEAEGKVDDLVKQTNKWVNGVKPSQVDRGAEIGSLAKTAAQAEDVTNVRSAVNATQDTVKSLRQELQVANDAAKLVGKSAEEAGGKVAAKAAGQLVSKAGLVVDVVLGVATAIASVAGEAAVGNDQGPALHAALDKAKNTPYDIKTQMESENGRLGLVQLLAASF